jgi:hypothetical protein
MRQRSLIDPPPPCGLKKTNRASAGSLSRTGQTRRWCLGAPFCGGQHRPLVDVSKGLDRETKRVAVRYIRPVQLVQDREAQDRTLMIASGELRGEVQQHLGRRVVLKWVGGAMSEALLPVPPQRVVSYESLQLMDGSELGTHRQDRERLTAKEASQAVIFFLEKNPVLSCSSVGCFQHKGRLVDGAGSKADELSNRHHQERGSPVGGDALGSGELRGKTLSVSGW